MDDNNENDENNIQIEENNDNNNNNIENENENEANEEEEQNQESDNNNNNNNTNNEILSTESVDENYMIELHNKLSKMQQERKDVQSQAKILNNRVAMLKNQEMKNLRKIEDTKKLVNNKILRLQEIVENKKILEERKRIKELEIENKKNKNKNLKEEIESNYQKSKALHEKRIEEVGKISKIKKEYNKQIFSELKKENLTENKIKYNCMKNQKN